MIKYSSADSESNPYWTAIVQNIKTKENFAVSTIRNLCDVYETTVVRAPNLWIAGLKAFLSKIVFIVNSSTLEQARQAHIRTAELFEQLNPKELIREYKTKGRVGLQFFVSEEDKLEK